MNLRFAILTAVAGAAMAAGMTMFTSQPASASMFNFVDCTTITAANTIFPVPGCPAVTTPFDINSQNSSLTYKSTDGLVTGLVVSGSTGLPGGTVPTNIQIKNDFLATGEVGLGIAKNAPNFEITPGDLINIDTSGVKGPGTATSATVTIESIQSGEGFKECLGNTVGALGTVDCNTFTNPPGGVTQTFSLNIADLLAHPVLGITASAGDVLLNAQIETFSAPEPSSLTLLSSGFIGLGLVPFVRRRFGW